MEYVILGAGAAGITAAKTIRKADKNGKITKYFTRFVLGENEEGRQNTFLILTF